MQYEIRFGRPSLRSLTSVLAASMLLSASAGCVTDTTTAPATPVADAPDLPAVDTATRRPRWEPSTEPGEGLCFGELPVQNCACDAAWGDVLTDLIQHVPSGWEADYDEYAVGYARNATRSINRFLRDYYAKPGENVNAFYVLDGRFVTLPEPRIRKSDVAAFIPASLRGPLYQELVAGRSDLDSRPLFLLDEWVAYTNGGASAVERIHSGLWRAGTREALYGQLELSVYALALLRAVEARDPQYFADQDQLWEFTAFELERSLAIYRDGKTLTELRSNNQETYERLFRYSADAAPLRDFARRVFGDRWAAEVLGVQ